jgi:Gpi18-like mannosyltransferase
MATGESSDLCATGKQYPTATSRLGLRLVAGQQHSRQSGAVPVEDLSADRAEPAGASGSKKRSTESSLNGEVISTGEPTGAAEAPAPVPWFWWWATLAGSLLLRFSLFNFRSGDYRAFLGPWYDFFVEHGRWHVLGPLAKQLHSYCYPPLYLYLLSLSTWLPVPKLYAIKLISVAGDYAAAWYFWRLLRRGRFTPRAVWAGVTAFLFLPTVVMNSAVWGQCDVLYTGPLLASLFYLLEGRSMAALVAFGVALSMKPQAIFWCPLLAGLLVSGRPRWKHLWIPAAVYVACAVPAMVAGQTVIEALARWRSAAIHPMGLTVGAPNWYQWVTGLDPKLLSDLGVALTVVATVAVVWWMRAGPRAEAERSEWLVSWALLSVLFPPFFLPGVHERYFFAADVLSLVYAFYIPRRWAVALWVQIASGAAYAPYLFGTQLVPYWCLALVMAAAIVWVAAGLWRLPRGASVAVKEVCS